MSTHKVDWGPGWRYFECSGQALGEGCAQRWREKCRDCQSPSSSVCPTCGEVTAPVDFERHYEWATDASGNLVESDGDVEMLPGWMTLLRSMVAGDE